MKDLLFIFTITLTLAAASFLKQQNAQDMKPAVNQKYLSYNK